ncbi:MAG: hypothetical protein GY768_24720, partial [Planctomycetaceae bacterium]|nr:hypothetical protein [Planctomycetaceae bacterium]
MIMEIVAIQQRLPQGTPEEWARIMRACDRDRPQVERDVQAAIRARMGKGEPPQQAAAEQPSASAAAAPCDPGAGISGGFAADTSPGDQAEMWLSPDPIPLPMGERRAEDPDIVPIDLEDDVNMLDPPEYRPHKYSVDTHETHSGVLVCSWDRGDEENYPTNHPMWTAETFVIHPAVKAVCRRTLQRKIRRLKGDPIMLDLMIKQLAASRKAAQLVPLTLALTDVQRAKAVSRSPDEIPVLNYRLDGSSEGSFYKVGKEVPAAMFIFDAHNLDPDIDAAWCITSAGQEVDGVSGRAT